MLYLYVMFARASHRLMSPMHLGTFHKLQYDFITLVMTVVGVSDLEPRKLLQPATLSKQRSGRDLIGMGQGLATNQYAHDK